MNMLDDSATWLAGQLENHTGRSATYSRGQASVSVTGTLAIRTHHVMDEEGFASAVQSYDWTFEAADLVLYGEAVTPRVGDRIVADGVTYEAMPLRDGQPWETADAKGLLCIVHTKRVV